MRRNSLDLFYVSGVHESNTILIIPVPSKFGSVAISDITIELDLWLGECPLRVWTMDYQKNLMGLTSKFFRHAVSATLFPRSRVQCDSTFPY